MSWQRILERRRERRDEMEGPEGPPDFPTATTFFMVRKRWMVMS